MSDDELKQRILSRRAKFVAAAIAASGLAACGGEVSGPIPDASAADAPKDQSVDAPQVCLSAPFDAGQDAPADAASDADAGPQPCLVPPQDGG
jgi:hypothetical protein